MDSHNRLIHADRVAYRGAMSRAVLRWQADGGPASYGADVLALTRIGAGAIGCSLSDLRTGELIELERAAASIYTRGNLSAEWWIA